MLPPAPGRLSGTIVHLLLSATFCATTRERMSVPPPGGNGTISLMGRVGYSCAAAEAAKATSATAMRRWIISGSPGRDASTIRAPDPSCPFAFSFGSIAMADRLDLRDLRYFEAIADAGHVGRAAKALHRTQPALTGAIRRLEETLGTRLFERAGRGIRLTAAGEALHS